MADMRREAERRYRLICVAPEVQDRGSYDDLDEAIVNSDAHFEVYDTQAPEGESPWVGAYCQEDYDAAVARWRAKAGAV
jgi:hypothetical protein